MSAVPMRPDGALVVTDTAVTTTFGVDEWGTEHYWTGNSRPPRMNRDDLNEAMELLGDVHELLLRRDATAMFWLRLLRSIDRQARG